MTKIDKIEEPYILAQIITKSEFLGNVIKLCIDKRGVMKNQTFITQDRVEVNFDMPLSEIVFDFYDKLKSISKGYASFDYHRTGFQPSKLVKLDILLNGEPVDALSSLTYTDHAYDFGRKMCEKLKELIPRQQFDIAIQAAVGAKIIARETVNAITNSSLRPMPRPASRRSKPEPDSPRSASAPETRWRYWPKAATHGSFPNWGCSTPGRSACPCR